MRKDGTIYCITGHRNLEALLEGGRITHKEFSYLDDILERTGPFLLRGDEVRDVASITGWVKIPNAKELR